MTVRISGSGSAKVEVSPGKSVSILHAPANLTNKLAGFMTIPQWSNGSSTVKNYYGLIHFQLGYVGNRAIRVSLRTRITSIDNTATAVVAGRQLGWYLTTGRVSALGASAYQPPETYKSSRDSDLLHYAQGGVTSFNNDIEPAGNPGGDTEIARDRVTKKPIPSEVAILSMAHVGTPGTSEYWTHPNLCTLRTNSILMLTPGDQSWASGSYRINLDLDWAEL